MNMDNQYPNNGKLESFVEGFIEANKIINSYNPDHVLAPMTGAIPFIDVLHIINPDFDINKVEYLPASISRIYNCREVIKDWFTNFLHDVYKNQKKEKTKLISIDEVVSGQSCMAIYNQFESAIRSFANGHITNLKKFLFEENKNVSQDIQNIDNILDHKYTHELTEINKDLNSEDKKTKREGINTLNDILIKHYRDLFEYKIIGIEDSRGKCNINTYNNLVRKKVIFPVPVKEIITMDRPELCPAKYKFKGGSLYFPEIEGFTITKEYIEFLKQVAAYIGKPPESISPVNEAKIMSASKFLSKIYKKDY